MADIVTRLRQTRADMIGTDDEQHYWDCHEAAGEIERLRRWCALTAEEREAIANACKLGTFPDEVATLRRLLARTGQETGHTYQK